MKIHSLILLTSLANIEAMYRSRSDAYSDPDDPQQFDLMKEVSTNSLLTDISLNTVSDHQHSHKEWDENALKDLGDEDARKLYDFKLRMSEATLASIHKNTRDLRAFNDHVKLEIIIIKELIHLSKTRIDKIMAFCGTQVILIFVILILQTIFFIGNSYDSRRH